MRIGVVGCGHVSDQYFEGLGQNGEVLEVVACADADQARAMEQANRYGVARILDPNALISDTGVDLIVNLTPPRVHYSISAAAIENGKHVYSEKPLAIELRDARRLVDLARQADVRLGCAPDTFLGGGLQTARKLLDDGWIGRPLSAVAFVSEPGYEHFHPNVDFFYEPGGGPLLDLGPYYVTALVNMFGPVHRVCGCTRITFPERRIRTGERAGTRIPVQTPTHATGAMEFASGAIATLLASWDIWATTLPYIEVYGSAGSLGLPNPDEFGGHPRLRVAGAEDVRQPPAPPGALPWTSIPLRFSADVGRGFGVADMVRAIATGSQHRASGDLALHVLEVLLAIERSSVEKVHIEIESRCERPAPLDLSAGGQELA